MKVIDLLVKIANGEASDLTTRFIFNDKEYSFYSLNHSDYCLDEFLLNQEIEIIEDTPKDVIITLQGTPNSIRKYLGLPPKEDKKIEKIKSLNNVGNCQDLTEFKDKQQLNNHILKDKINEILDKLNEGKDE